MLPDVPERLLKTITKAPFIQWSTTGPVKSLIRSMPSRLRWALGKVAQSAPYPSVALKSKIIAAVQPKCCYRVGLRSRMSVTRTQEFLDSMISKKLAADAGAVADFLTMMGNEKRLLIMNQLAGGELSVGMLAGKVLLSQSALSQHLAKLRAFGLVDARRDGKMVYYFCSSSAARELLAMLDGFLMTERLGAGPQYVADRLRRLRTV